MKRLVSIILFVLMLYALDVNAQYKYYLYIGPSVSSTTGSGIPIRNSLKGECVGNYDDATSTIIGINGRGGYIQTNGFLTEDNATFLSIVPIYKIPIGKYYSDPKDSSNFSCSKTCSNISLARVSRRVQVVMPMCMLCEDVGLKPLANVMLGLRAEARSY